jgi:hypothetical protein
LGTAPLFFVSVQSSFLMHPHTNVGCAVHHLDAVCQALIQEANSIEVDGIDLIQVQRCRLSALLDFSAKIDEVRASKFTGQKNPSPVILTKLLDS